RLLGVEEQPQKRRTIAALARHLGGGTEVPDLFVEGLSSLELPGAAQLRGGLGIAAGLEQGVDVHALSLSSSPTRDRGGTRLRLRLRRRLRLRLRLRPRYVHVHVHVGGGGGIGRLRPAPPPCYDPPR